MSWAEELASHLLTGFAFCVAAFLFDVGRSGRHLGAASLCEVVPPAGASAHALALLLLTLGHKFSVQPPTGAVRVTAQTLVLCVNGLCFRPGPALLSVCAYVGLGMAVSAGVGMCCAAYGPEMNTKSVG